LDPRPRLAIGTRRGFFLTGSGSALTGTTFGGTSGGGGGRASCDPFPFCSSADSIS